MKERKITITLIDARRNRRWLGTLLSISLTVCLPIGLGVALDSTAMQWLGFIFALLALGGIVFSNTKGNSFDNVDAAKARLDEFAKEETL